MLIRPLPPPPPGGRNRCEEMQENIDCLSKKFGRAVVGVQDNRFAPFPSPLLILQAFSLKEKL